MMIILMTLGWSLVLLSVAMAVAIAADAWDQWRSDLDPPWFLFTLLAVVVVLGAAILGGYGLIHAAQVM